MWSLHHRQLFLFQEPAHGHLQERSRWYVVAVENRHELAFGIFQRIVDVARFRMFMSGTGDIFHPHVLRKLAKLFPTAVIEDPDVQLVFRPVDTQRGVNSIFHHVEIFVVSRDKDIHRRPQRHIFRQWHRLTIQRPYYLEVAEHQHTPRVRFSEEAEIQPRSDEKRILSNVAVLEGAPPLSEHWQLFNNNEVLFNEARTAQAATVVFSLQQNAQIEPLARSIHTLRRQRGSAMKILVRENTASLRATDERLLLACGANMVIPWNAPLSRCLTMIESVQGQKFSRYVPEDITTLLSMTQPLKLRGFQKWDVFCNAVNNMMNNPLLPAHGKGVLVALRPVPGIRVEQALTLCRPNRTGDIMTIGGNRLVLFLSFCRINDLDTALNHIFPLPTGDIFSNRMVWFEDDQISAELVQMRLLAPEQWGMPLPLTQSSKPVINAEHDGRHWRRIPEPMRLLDDAVERSS